MNESATRDTHGVGVEPETAILVVKMIRALQLEQRSGAILRLCERDDKIILVRLIDDPESMCGKPHTITRYQHASSWTARQRETSRHESDAGSTVAVTR